MKKMLVLALVLSVAGLANAWIVTVDKTTVNVGESFTMTIAAEAGQGYADLYAGVFESAADIAVLNYSSAIKGAQAPDLAKVAATYDWAADDYEGVDIVVDSTNGQFTAGEWFKVTFTGMQMGAGRVQFYDYEDEQAVSFFPITVVPEPMTMVLLGLGGLFLRKK